MNPIAAIITVMAGVCAASYLLGSVSFAVIFTKVFAGVDVRDYGSKNAGMTNVSRVAGKKAAALTFICDVAKGAVAVILSRYIGVWFLDKLAGTVIENSVDPQFFAYLAGLFCVIGHIYPLFFGFKGGKGVASMLGILLFVDWRTALITLLVFIIVLVFSRIVSLSSLSAAIAYPILTFLMYDGGEKFKYVFLGLNQHMLITLCALCYALILFFTHRTNIIRLIHGQERKIGGKKSKETAAENNDTDKA